MSYPKLYIKKLSPILIIFFLLTIINLPKYNIISIGGFGNLKQGIRLDDILILLFVTFNIKKISFTRDSILIFTYVSFAYLVSFFHQSNSIHFHFVQFHYLRFLEYFLLYSTLINIVSKNQILKIAIITILIQLFYGAYAYFNLPFQEEFTKDSRAKGTTAGPWEFINVIVLSYFIVEDYFQRKKKFFYTFSFYVMTWFLISISYSRMTAIAFLIILAIKEIKFTIIVMTIILFIILLDINLVIFQNIDIGYFSLIKTFSFLKDFGEPILNYFLEGNFFLGRGGTFYDETAQNYSPSLVSRLQQWGRYLTTLNNSEIEPIAYIIGSGPGSGSIINDGMYIKLFVDFGLIGILIYFYFIIKYFISNKKIRYIIIYISIVSTTLDFYWPTKISYTLILLMIYFKNSISKIETKNLKLYRE